MSSCSIRQYLLQYNHAGASECSRFLPNVSSVVPYKKAGVVVVISGFALRVNKCIRAPELVQNSLMVAD